MYINTYTLYYNMPLLNLPVHLPQPDLGGKAVVDLVKTYYSITHNTFIYFCTYFYTFLCIFVLLNAIYSHIYIYIPI